MKPIQFPEQNCIMKGDDGVGDLPVFMSQNYVTSKWELSPEDIKFIQEMASSIY
jgi:hypothetical protein